MAETVLEDVTVLETRHLLVVRGGAAAAASTDALLWNRVFSKRAETYMY